MPSQPTPQTRWLGVLRALACCTLVAIATDSYAEEATPPAGQQIFKDQCARCHGKTGEGVADGYPDPLAGDKSVAELTKLSHETMPDDADDKCPAEDSAKVAAYIYDAFYSPDARVRNKP